MSDTQIPEHAKTVTALHIESFMRVRSIDITPEQIGLVELRGANAAGKSSVLRAMWAAIGGKNESPGVPVRDGAEKATARVELGDLIVERTWRTDGSSRLEVTNRAGAVYKRPQQILDALTSKIAFDPVAFMRYDQRKQAAVLRDVAGVDTTAAEGAVERKFRERGDQNTIVSTLAARVGDEPGNPEPIDTDAINERLDAARAAEKARDEAAAELKQADTAKFEAADELATLDAEIDRLKEQRKDLVAAKKAANEQRAKAALKRDKAAEAAAEYSDTEQLREQLRKATAVQVQRQDHERWRERADELERERERAKTLTAELEALREELAALVRSGEYPIEGLEVRADGVFYADQPLEQASSAEQLRVSMAMAIATHPDLQIVHIKEGSLLDARSLELVRDMAVQEGYQVWIEIVDDSGAGALVIEDGALKAGGAS